MSSNSDDIQAAGSDTRPPMLDRTDYESMGTSHTNLRLIVLLGPEMPVHMRTSVTRRRNDTMQKIPCHLYCASGLPKDYLQTLQSKHLKRNQVGATVKMILGCVLISLKEDRESQLYAEFERFKAWIPGHTNLSSTLHSLVGAQDVGKWEYINESMFVSKLGSTEIKEISE
ncbi:hypothetical protein Tco_0090232 [Tanacetum coccineum]